MKNNIILVILLGISVFVDCLPLNDQEEDKSLNAQESEVSAVQKRDILQFSGMIRCATGRSAWKYFNYGNWCGWGGSGTAVDGVDSCCRSHDWCYKRHDSCYPKIIPYIASTSGSHPSCSITCHSANNRCQRDVCNCDKVAAECFARNTYHPNNKH
uniref:Phospholipase A2 A2-actitoxin-Ucs2a n=1 Tax=Urticina crassicornis TaxID=45621 RepID=PA2_URTCR|nr:RecName: Full=Phospholipase A2 A2-actitoxin-Ucs2a; Short=A2-AITX-Ucs2a; AltName: Full=Phosphatidylcholine 2-acylhydrolase; AltName: Full=UcPLA2; Flags: Precursor [Urticina crassicornis]ABS19666.1 phospholipase A2 [Urticina crassicornis]